MRSILRRLFGGSKRTAHPSPKTKTKSETTTGTLPFPESPGDERSDVSRRRPRRRIRTMPLSAVKMLSKKTVVQLREIGVCSVGDLAEADLHRIASRCELGHRRMRYLKLCQRAAKLSVAVKGLRPREARILIAIHRTSPIKIAGESAVRLHRDIQRFALSTAGAKLLAGRECPPLEKVQQWIAGSKSLVNDESQQTLARV